MADNIKISDLDALTAAQNSTIVPVVDGGTTKKMELSTLQTHLTASFATPSQLSTQISNVNSTIDALTTDDIAEGSNEYYTNAKVDEYLGDIGAITASQMVDALQIQNLNSAVIGALGGTDIISGSLTSDDITDFDTAVSTSAASAGFGAGGGGGGVVDLSGTGIVSSSTQITSLGFISESISASYSSFALTASYALNGGGGGGTGSTDYISNVTFATDTLTFTGVGDAFDGTVTMTFVPGLTYTFDSASFQSRITSLAGGGGSVPVGTVSSSAQTIKNLGGSGIFSSSTQALDGVTADDISEGVSNSYYTNTKVLNYINSLNIVSGSVVAEMDFSGTNIVSTSTQIENLGFVINTTFGVATQSLQSQIDEIDVGVSVNDVNTFLAIQKFTQDVEVTGSILLNGGSFSGSGANLFNIPANAIVGGVGGVSSISDGTNTLAVDYSAGINATVNTGSFNVLGGDLIISGGVFSGSGAGLYDIPGSAIIGGVDGQKIYSSSFSASITDNAEFLVNTNAIFESDIYSSGSITATAISVGASGTPTIYSNNNLNLSASNAVIITDSPLRLNPFTNTETGSFTLSNGDLVYNSTTHDFYGYKSGSWISLTAGNTAADVNWANIIGIPSGLVSSSAGFVSSSAQILPDGGTGDILFRNSIGIVTSSAAFRYTEGTETLTSPTMSVGVLTYSSLSGPAAATGSFNLVDADRVLINNAVEMPTSDGSVNQVIKTDGNGITSFGDIDWTEITSIPNGIISASVQLPTNLATKDGDNNFSVSQTITGSLFVSSSTITDVLVITPKHPKPTLPETGSIIVSASAAGPLRPFFYDGTAWFQMFT